MYFIKNNLNQPQTIGEQTLPADGQIEVETADKKLRGLDARGFISITKIEPESNPAAAGNQTSKTETSATGNKEKK